MNAPCQTSLAALSTCTNACNKRRSSHHQQAATTTTTSNRRCMHCSAAADKAEGSPGAAHSPLTLSSLIPVGFLKNASVAPHRPHTPSSEPGPPNEGATVGPRSPPPSPPSGRQQREQLRHACSIVDSSRPSSLSSCNILLSQTAPRQLHPTFPSRSYSHLL